MSAESERCREFTAGDWAALREYIDARLGDGFGNVDFVCRGEPRQYPSVLPVIDRLLPADDVPGGLWGRLEAEIWAMVRFRQHSAMHLDSLQRQMLDEGLQTQVVMRHYAAPTRLLDWTESPWVALFFACEDAGQPPGHEGLVGRVLAFDRAMLERAVREQYSEESPAHAEVTQSEHGITVPRLLSYKFAAGAKDWVVCYHRHAEKFPRLVAQQGLFTLASKPWLDHWESVKRLCPEHNIEIRIQPGLKAEVLRRLAKMGVTAATLFPDIEGVAREVGSYTRIGRVI